MPSREPWACPGCLRVAAEARQPNARCQDADNQSPGRCVWRARIEEVDAPAAAAGTAAAPMQGDAMGAKAMPEDGVELSEDKAQQLALRERLRTTEAIAAEAQALRSRMADELERVTGERDQLRASAATRFPATEPVPLDSATPTRAASKPRGAWLALGVIVGLLAGATGMAAWHTSAPEPAVASIRPPSAGLAARSPGISSEPMSRSDITASASVPAGSVSAASGVMPSASMTPTVAQDGRLASAVGLSPEATLAAMPTGAGPAPTLDIPARLRAALSVEGIDAPVTVDGGLARVAISDPASDNATRDRADTVIRAVFIGANLPEPRIEHRWLSPPRPQRTGRAPAIRAPATAAPVAPPRRVVASLEDDAQLSLPYGRLTAACRAGVANTPSTRRAAAMSACMRNSCCGGGHRNTEECRAYDASRPLSCPAS